MYFNILTLKHYELAKSFFLLFSNSCWEIAPISKSSFSFFICSKGSAVAFSPFFICNIAVTKIANPPNPIASPSTKTDMIEEK